MSNQIYSGFNQVNIGPFLALTAGDTILQTTDNVSSNRIAMSVYDQAVISNFEVMIYSPLFLSGAITTLPTMQAAVPPTVMIGIATAKANLNNYVGSDAFGFGYNPADGIVYNNGANVGATGVTATFNDVIGFLVDPVGATMQVYKNGIPIGSPIAITASKSWFIAATISGTPGTFAIVLNVGLTPFVYPLNGQSGWWVARQSIIPLNFGSEPYMALGTDIAPYEKYAGDINTISQPTQINDSVRFWMWGNSAPGELGAGGLVQMQIDDPNGAYTDLSADAARQMPCVISRVRSSAALSTAEVLFTGVFDHCEADTRVSKQIYFRDQMSRLVVAVQRALFSPGADANVASKPRPISMGVCRNYSPELYDVANLLYALHDGSISALGRVRVAGKQVVLGGDFNMTNDLSGIDFIAAPIGVVTVESTDTGGAFSSAATDYLAGAGVFTSITNSGGATTGNSNTSVLVGTGSKSFTILSPSTHAFSSGSGVVATNGVNSMTGTVTSYNSGTGVLVINVASVTGSGTLTPWVITGGVNQPTGWACAGGYPNDFLNTLAQVNGSSPNKFVRFAQEAAAIQWFYPLTPIVLHQNHSYAFQVVTSGIPAFGAAVDAQGAQTYAPPGKLVFGYLQNAAIYWTHFYEISLDHVGTYTGVFINNSGADRNLVIGFLPNLIIQGGGGVSSYLDLKSIVLNELPALSDNIALTGPGLTEMSKRVLVTHGPVDISELTIADTDAIDATTNYSYGKHIAASDSPLVSDIDLELMNSVLSCRYNDELGKYRTARLFAPEGIADINLAGTLTTTDVKGEIICYPDLAEMLTTRLSGCKNYNPLGGSDYGATTTSDTPLNVRAQLGADYQWTVAAGIQLAYRYLKAYNMPALKTLLDVQAHGLAEIIYANMLYTVARNFYVGTFFEPIGRSFKLMQPWKLTYNLPTLKNGTKLVIVGRQRRPASEQCNLILWGM